MWRWAVGFIFLGLIELLLVIQLHQWFSTKVMVLIYLTTTIVGFLFLYAMRNMVFKGPEMSKKSQKKLSQKLKHNRILSEAESLQFKSQLMMMFFTFAWVLIIIPGLITDVLGVVMVIPGLMNWIVDKSIIEHNQKTISHSDNLP